MNALTIVTERTGSKKHFSFWYFPTFFWIEKKFVPQFLKSRKYWWNQNLCLVVSSPFSLALFDFVFTYRILMKLSKDVKACSDCYFKCIVNSYLLYCSQESCTIGCSKEWTRLKSWYLLQKAKGRKIWNCYLIMETNQPISLEKRLQLFLCSGYLPDPHILSVVICLTFTIS